jgi:hypothetical protein
MAQKKRPEEIMPVEKLLYWIMNLEEHEIERILAKIVFSSSLEKYKEHSANLFRLIYASENAKEHNTWYYQKSMYDNFKHVDEWKNCALMQRILAMPDSEFIYTFDWFVQAALREWVLYKSKLIDTLILDVLEVPYDKNLVEYFYDSPGSIHQMKAKFV